MKKKLMKILKTIAFLGVFVCLLYLTDCVLKFKYQDGVKPMENFYDLPEDTVDVLLLGSSHIGMNVDPTILWEEQGIAAYACWGGMQPTWNTYYYLKECLKYQTPKLVVMDTYLVTNDMEYDSYENMVKNIVGMRWSKNKLDAIQTAVRPEYRDSVLLGLPTYHYRYASLTADDFKEFPWNKHTEIQSINSIEDKNQPIHIPDYSGIMEAEELSEKLGTYFLKIIDLCEEKEIPLLLVASPYELREIEQRRYNKIAEIAKERGLTFLNFNNFYSSIGIDTETDYLDPGHFNANGIRKYSAFLADYMKQNYELPDRRLDGNHIWNVKRDTDEKMVYKMKEQFIGGGLNYLDTEEKLYENPFASYTLLARIDTRCISDDKVWFSCFSEEPEHYRGLLVRREHDTIYVIFNGTQKIELTEFPVVFNLGIVKNGLNYKVYVDGEFAGELTLNQLDSYDGTLLLGCQVNEEGKRFRYSDTIVENLELYSIALEASEIQKWKPEVLPVPKANQTMEAGSDAAFELSKQFVGNGFDKYIDTGVGLYEDPASSWILLTKFSETSELGGGVYFSCFHEKEGEYRGILARHVDPGVINLMYGNKSINVEVEEDSEVSLVITKDRFKYNIYVNGKHVVKDELIEVEEYRGNLLIGCQETYEGEKMRFSEVNIYNLEVYKGVMDEAKIRNWDPAHKELPPRKEPSPVDYVLSQPFMGDGKAAFLDTGIQLYDVADKNWCLEMRFRKEDTYSQMLASCFAEDPKSYRGLIITLLDELTMSLTLGQTSLEVELPPEPEQTVKVVKQGYEYSVYINGELAADPVFCKSPEYDGTLHLGCAVNADGKEFRFSKVQILKLTVEDTTESFADHE